MADLSYGARNVLGYLIRDLRQDAENLSKGATSAWRLTRLHLGKLGPIDMLTVAGRRRVNPERAKQYVAMKVLIHPDTLRAHKALFGMDLCRT